MTPQYHPEPPARKNTNPRAVVLAAMPKYLRTCAHAVETLGSGYRANPEKIAAHKDEIVKTLKSLAVLIEREAANG